MIAGRLESKTRKPTKEIVENGARIINGWKGGEKSPTMVVTVKGKESGDVDQMSGKGGERGRPGRKLKGVRDRKIGG